MEKEMVSVQLNKIKAELLLSLREDMKNMVSKEDLYVFRLEDYCSSLRNGIINANLTLPSISSFKFYFSKLQKVGNIEYVLELLHECWLLAYPDNMFNSAYKDTDPIKILDSSLSKYDNKDSSYGDSSYDVVSEELNTSINITIAQIYYHNACKNKDQLHLYREYIDKLYTAINSIFHSDEITIEKGFIPVCCLKTTLNRDQQLSLFKAISSEGFMVNDKMTQYSFLSLFSNTLHTSDKKIIWLDINKKNHQPTIASLYTMFSAIGVEMNTHNKSIICKLFIDANNNPISPESLKPRNESESLRRIKSIVDEILTS